MIDVLTKVLNGGSFYYQAGNGRYLFTGLRGSVEL